VVSPSLLCWAVRMPFPTRLVIEPLKLVAEVSRALAMVYRLNFALGCLPQKQSSLNCIPVQLMSLRNDSRP